MRVPGKAVGEVGGGGVWMSGVARQAEPRRCDCLAFSCALGDGTAADRAHTLGLLTHATQQTGREARE